MKKDEACLSLLVIVLLCLGFSFVLLSAAAVPISRSLKSVKDDSSIQDLLAKGGNEMEMRTEGEQPDFEEVFIQGRMDWETSTDYPGAGANNHHSPPKPPGGI